MDCAPTLRALDEKKFELEVESDTIEQLTSLLQEQLHRLQARTPPPPPSPKPHPHHAPTRGGALGRLPNHRRFFRARRSRRAS